MARYLLMIAGIFLATSCEPAPLPNAYAYCLEGKIEFSGEARDQETIDRTCAEYAKHFRRDPRELMSGSEVYVLVQPRPQVKTFCSGGAACAVGRPLKTNYTIVLPPEPRPTDWLRHELFHVFLWQQGVPTSDHHALMDQKFYSPHPRP